MKEKILVIEDNEPTRRNIAKILTFEDFDVSLAEDGKAGLDIARKIKPDIILCDIMMPVMDGFQVIQAAQEDKDLAAIPFIFLTALAETENIRRGMNEGADDYLTKPVNPDILIASVRKRLDKKNKMESDAKRLAEETGLRIAAIIPADIQQSLQHIDALIGSLALKHADKDPDILEAHHIVKSHCDYLARLIRRVSLCHQLPALYANRFENQERERTLDAAAAIKKIAENIARLHQGLSRLQLDTNIAQLAISTDFLEILLTELLGNAFKFSPPDKPIILIAKESSAFCELSVLDEGEGMTPKQIASISSFKQFWGGEQKPPSLGIGLTIVQGLVRLHDGEFEINQRTPRGLEVKCFIPTEA